MGEDGSGGWIGTVLQDRWRVEARIGRGGVGTVFRAVHRQGHRAAIKLMHPQHARHADARARFVREGYAANKVNHPGVVRVVDDGVTPDGSPFLVMELLENGELLEERRLRLGGRIPYRQVAHVGAQVLDVLAAAHESGIIHRDVKPENIYVLADGTAKLLDFGVAHVKEATRQLEPTGTGVLLGTPEFMAPEQAVGTRGAIDAATDIYALGATLFTLASGRAVHENDMLAGLIVMIATTPAKPLTLVAPFVPSAFAAVVDRALAFEKARRWPSARAMQQALLAAVPDAIPALPSAEAPPSSDQTTEERTRVRLPPEDVARYQRTLVSNVERERPQLPLAPPPSGRGWAPAPDSDGLPPTMASAGVPWGDETATDARPLDELIDEAPTSSEAQHTVVIANATLPERPRFDRTLRHPIAPAPPPQGAAPRAAPFSPPYPTTPPGPQEVSRTGPSTGATDPSLHRWAIAVSVGILLLVATLAIALTLVRRG